MVLLSQKITDQMYNYGFCTNKLISDWIVIGTMRPLFDQTVHNRVYLHIHEDLRDRLIAEREAKQRGGG